MVRRFLTNGPLVVVLIVFAVSLLFDVALAERADEKIDRLTQTIEKAQNRGPELAKALLDRGWAWGMKRQYDRALADFQKAAEIIPNSVDAFNALGWAWEKKGQRRKSIQSYETAVRLDPKSAESHEGLGWNFLALNRPEKASESFKKAVDLDPDLASAYSGLGWADLELKRYGESISAFKKAVALTPNDPDPHNGLSHAYEAKGMPAEAADSLRRLLQLDPEADGAGTRLKRLEARLPQAARPSNQTTLPSGIPLPASEQRLALVIGNSAYAEFPPLKNPVNDAEDMAAALKKCGFKVIRRLNADRKQMREDIRNFGEQLKKGGMGLFFFAGHGLQVDGENYLVPIGARIAFEDEVEDECLKASAVLRKMESAGNRLNIIILDACRNNPLPSRKRSALRGLAKMEAPRGSLLVYATAPGEAAIDGEGRNGLFTSMLLKHMLTPGLAVESMLKRVRVDVMAESGEIQVPWNASSLTGEFSFVPQ